ncbi:ABC transporter ATP-binding protein [Rhodospirillaceae bacterium]|jgi:ABC-2 type transport system ATP-binding protein|nr:ABC transporter ATP-binding protein [Rhodospirillaceae bacterium]MBT6305918.1 ABC transporter ATP-binding protein [Rhodospirillaceae bacterium]MBT7733205.1 ABC transporter ATP-binding protein [Rhodospirillaceae bacterium]MDC1442855.1 ABC transporter ATP-binding protein [Rhodospirillaceae bacterium]MDG1885648.1 ABC transporter ATP-binding protein [Alphaproteobacteria bacterium]|tara:strand:- start:344 stop:1096 length:753 start_codon:yes stop_codon:yes gene_type:complete
MSGFAVEVDSLAKYFGNVVAIENVSFKIKSGSITALLGGNGAGKTTTISILMGLLTPSKGTVYILGENMVEDRYRILPDINFSSPYVDLPHRLTVKENLKVYAELYSIISPNERIRELAERFDIEPLLEQKTGQLSAGQKTRVALAKALINNPKLLFLDEPTASLDPDTADWVRTYLQQYAADKNATILLASHHMGEVERLCDTVLMMRDGGIVDRGSPKELLKKYGRTNLEDVFLDIARNRVEQVSFDE